MTERRKEDILAPAGHPELNVNFSKSKGASIKKENISDASPLLKKRAEVTSGGSWSDFISQNGVSPSSETPPNRKRKPKPGTPYRPKTPQNKANNGGAGTQVKMLVDFLSRKGKPFRINLTMPRDCNMQMVLAKVRPAAAIHLIRLRFD